MEKNTACVAEHQLFRFEGGASCIAGLRCACSRLPCVGQQQADGADDFMPAPGKAGKHVQRILPVTGFAQNVTIHNHHNIGSQNDVFPVQQGLGLAGKEAGCRMGLGKGRAPRIGIGQFSGAGRRLSPGGAVAGWMMAKRGLELIAVHFASPPYTSPQAEMKVHSLLKKVTAYSGRIVLFTVPFTKIQEEIRKNCPEELFTLIMRRFMMKISGIIAEKEDCGALVTGESLAQVASQTTHAISCTDAAATLPVFRPLIGMDKDDVIKLSRKIETFEISIKPYEDCCTIFTPKHPRTRPILKFVEQAESALDVETLVDEAVANLKVMAIK